MIYVDDARIQFGRMKMSHLIADSTEELLAMAEALGLRRAWIQHEGTPREHFDVSLEKRRRAIELGAKPVSRRELVSIIRARR